MCTFNPTASDDCYIPTTLAWNNSTNCCSCNRVHCDEMTGQVIELDVSCSGLQGKFHSNSSLFQLSNLKRLDLSFNNFFGSLISAKFSELSSLMHLDLSRSGFIGLIPVEISHLSTLQVLRIWSDDLYGLTLGPYNFELLLKNVTQLKVLELFSVNISSSIPLNFSSYLTTLWLRDTVTRGIARKSFRPFQLEIPLFIIQLPNWSDSIQHWASDPERLERGRGQHKGFYGFGISKGTDLELPRVLTSHMFIDLSRNRFEGYLPTIIGDLVGLRVLNLFHNGLEGIIPESLHQLSVLESLDLSSNKIGSEIPQQLASLTFLAVLNLSHNHLVGCIPKGKQFNMFESSSYQGNDGLRGLPLSKDCGGNDGVPQASTPVELDDEEEEGDLISW
ncbi:hypothetical protein T459_03340 [Capsicum annuum]|uniref:Leucine-rich repeat-containing N-terminal plant-type domain-containing protein n=1 Tax=Capsicum annuum TaxID=4072 RepID=A0A2G3AML5_CAPAN|nr:hypothetical protein T459_03340 [Capsicum annuum]